MTITAAVDAEGFLLDATNWDEGLAVQIARDAGIELTDRHWEVVRFMRDRFFETGSGPNVRALSLGSGIPVKELYALFPKGPAKLAARIAGIPKPRGCI